MAAPAAGFESSHLALAVADRARFFKSWLEEKEEKGPGSN